VDRITISMDENLARQFDELIQKNGYENRSEAIRDLLRDRLEGERLQTGQAPFCVASLSYVYNHHSRDLAERLTDLQHQHHHVVHSAMHVHLNHDDCMETLILRGITAEVNRFANRLMAQPEVRHGRLNLIPVDMESPDHHHDHVHSHPRT